MAFFSLLVCGSVFVQALASYPKGGEGIYRVGRRLGFPKGLVVMPMSSHPGKNTSEILSPFPFLFTHI